MLYSPSRRTVAGSLFLCSVDSPSLTIRIVCCSGGKLFAEKETEGTAEGLGSCCSSGIVTLLGTVTERRPRIQEEGLSHTEEVGVLVVKHWRMGDALDSIGSCKNEIEWRAEGPRRRGARRDNLPSLTWLDAAAREKPPGSGSRCCLERWDPLTTLTPTPTPITAADGKVKVL